MWRRAIVSFFGSILGAAAGLGLLYLLLRYGFDSTVREGAMMNAIVVSYIMIGLTVAAGVWGAVTGGLKTALPAAVLCLEALGLSAGAAYAIFLSGVYPAQWDVASVGHITPGVGAICGAIAGAFMGWRFGGTRVLWRAAVVAALPTTLVYALASYFAILFQSVTLVLLFIPFVILTTYLGAVITPPARPNQDPQQQGVVQSS